MPNFKDVRAKFLPNLGQKWQKEKSFFSYQPPANSLPTPSVLPKNKAGQAKIETYQNLIFTSFESF